MYLPGQPRLVRKWSLNTGEGRTDKFRERIKIWIHGGRVTNWHLTARYLCCGSVLSVV